MVLIVYVTASSPTEAEAIAQMLINKKLAACVNIIPQITSIYAYKGIVQKDTEVSLFIKTTEDCFTQITKEIQAIHSYELPCIIALPITHGEPNFLAWITTSLEN